MADRIDLQRLATRVVSSKLIGDTLLNPETLDGKNIDRSHILDILKIEAITARSVLGDNKKLDAILDYIVRTGNDTTILLSRILMNYKRLLEDLLEVIRLDQNQLGILNDISQDYANIYDTYIGNVTHTETKNSIELIRNILERISKGVGKVDDDEKEEEEEEEEDNDSYLSADDGIPKKDQEEEKKNEDALDEPEPVPDEPDAVPDESDPEPEVELAKPRSKPPTPASTPKSSLNLKKATLEDLSNKKKSASQDAIDDAFSAPKASIQDISAKIGDKLSNPFNTNTSIRVFFGDDVLLPIPADSDPIFNEPFSLQESEELRKLMREVTRKPTAANKSFAVIRDDIIKSTQERTELISMLGRGKVPRLEDATDDEAKQKLRRDLCRLAFVLNPVHSKSIESIHGCQINSTLYDGGNGTQLVSSLETLSYRADLLQTFQTKECTHYMMLFVPPQGRWYFEWENLNQSFIEYKALFDATQEMPLYMTLMQDRYDNIDFFKTKATSEVLYNLAFPYILCSYEIISKKKHILDSIILPNDEGIFLSASYFTPVGKNILDNLVEYHRRSQEVIIKAKSYDDQSRTILERATLNLLEVVYTLHKLSSYKFHPQKKGPAPESNTNKRNAKKKQQPDSGPSEPNERKGGGTTKFSPISRKNGLTINDKLIEDNYLLPATLAYYVELAKFSFWLTWALLHPDDRHNREVVTSQIDAYSRAINLNSLKSIIEKEIKDRDLFIPDMAKFENTFMMHLNKITKEHSKPATQNN